MNSALCENAPRGLDSSTDHSAPSMANLTSHKAQNSQRGLTDRESDFVVCQQRSRKQLVFKGGFCHPCFPFAGIFPF